MPPLKVNFPAIYEISLPVDPSMYVTKKILSKERTSIKHLISIHKFF